MSDVIAPKDQTVIDGLTMRLDTVAGKFNRIHSDFLDTIVRLSGDSPEARVNGADAPTRPGELGVLEQIVERLEHIAEDIDADNIMFKRL